MASKNGTGGAQGRGVTRRRMLLGPAAALAAAGSLAGADAAGEEQGAGEEQQAGRGALRGYSLRLLDLAGEAERRVTIAREAGQYLGHPTTVLLEDGKTILCVYPKGHGKGAIVLRRSEDGGMHWSGPQPVPENWASSLETPTIHRVVDRAGQRRLVLFSGLYPIRYSLSADDGRTWTPLQPVGEFGGIVAMSDVVRTRQGDYLAFFHDDGRFFAAQPSAERKFTVYQCRSRDGGLHWERPQAIVQDRQGHLCEPGVVRSPDGRELAMLLRENSRKRNSYVSFSRNEGRSWSEPVELPGALTGDRHVAKYAKDGRLVITFRDTTHESATKGDWVAWVGHYADIASAKRAPGRGREGQYRVRLAKNHKGADCGYPGLEVLPDGTMVAVTYGHWSAGEEPYVICVRWRMEELDAMAANGGRTAG